MGNCKSNNETVKHDKNHNREKMFRFGVSFGQNDLNLGGHVQLGYTSKKIKNYGPVKQPQHSVIVPYETVTSGLETSISENHS